MPFLNIVLVNNANGLVDQLEDRLLCSELFGKKFDQKPNMVLTK